MYAKMRWKWHDVHVLWGLPNKLHITLSTSITAVCLYTHQRFLMMYFEAVINHIWRCTWRLGSSELRDALGGRDWQSLKCTWRLWSSELTDSLGGYDRGSWEMLLEAKIGWTHWCTWRPRSGELKNALGNRNWACSEIHLEAKIDQDWRSTWRRLIWRPLIWRWLIWRQSIRRQWIKSGGSESNLEGVNQICRQWIWRW